MSAVLVPENELQAVNTILDHLGESPVNSLTTGLPQAMQSLEQLRRVARQVQEQGWWFNQDTEYTLAVDSNGNVPVPANALLVVPYDFTKKYIQRGTRLYDLTNKTYTFTDAVKVNIIWGFGFEELPPQARTYITIRAARKMQDVFFNDQSARVFTATDEIDALNELKRAHIKVKRHNILTGGASRDIIKGYLRGGR